MKYQRFCLLPSFFALALLPSARAVEKEVELRRIDVDPSTHVVMPPGDEAGEKERVTFLGVETAPVGRTLGTQLGLPRDTGLVAMHVVEKSPATDVLREDDVMTKFDDQILVNMEQLGVLVRSHKEGDEVKLTVVRGGKETTLKVKLGAREVPRRGNAFFFRDHAAPGKLDLHGFIAPDEMPDLEKLHELPGLAPDEAQDVLRMIGRERGHVLAGPAVHVIRHGGKGATILDLPKSNITYSDDDGAIEIKADDNQRSLTVKDAKGAVLFSGPVTTDEQRKNLPLAILQRLEKLDSDTFEYEVGRDFKSDVVPLPAAGKTKISAPLAAEPAPLPRPL